MAIIHRFFYALRPPADVQRKIYGLGDRHAAGSQRVSVDRLHLTLWITADYDHVPEVVVAKLMEVGAHVEAAPPFVSLDQLAGSGRSIALRSRRPTKALRALHKGLRNPLSRWPILREGWSFSPHVILGYRDNAPFDRSIETIDWQADDLVLIHSLVGKTEHKELGRWPLIARQGELFA